MVRESLERFIPTPDTFLADYNDEFEKLTGLLHDERLLVYQSLIREVIDDDELTLFDWIPARHGDMRGNVRSGFLEGRDSREHRLQLKYVWEIVRVIAVLFENWLESGAINQSHVTRIIQQSTLPYDWNIFLHGVDRYFEGDYISSVHILAPQFENILRTWARVQGVPIKKRSQAKEVIWGDITLNDLLNDEAVENMLGQGLHIIIDWYFASPNTTGYRHRVAHGFITPDDCNATLAATTLWLGLKIIDQSIL